MINFSTGIFRYQRIEILALKRMLSKHIVLAKYIYLNKPTDIEKFAAGICPDVLPEMDSEMIQLRVIIFELFTATIQLLACCAKELYIIMAVYLMQ